MLDFERMAKIKSRIPAMRKEMPAVTLHEQRAKPHHGALAQFTLAEVYTWHALRSRIETPMSPVQYCHNVTVMPGIGMP
eukprot:5070610-Amphidinium_carterae.1